MGICRVTQGGLTTLPYGGGILTVKSDHDIIDILRREC